MLVKGGGACGPQDILDESLVVDSETKGIGNVFVYLRRAGDVHPDLKNPPDQPVRLQIENCVFKPRALLVRARQPVLIESRDPTSHEIHPHDLRNQTGVLRRLKVGANERDGARLQFERSEILPIKVSCDVHPHMVGYWLVLDHPYGAITDEQGRFRIENLPAGEHKLTVWHERAGYLDRAFEATVEPNRTTRLDPAEVPAEAMRPRSHSPAGM